MTDPAAVFIHHIATAVPPTAYDQDFVGRIMRSGFEEGSRDQKLMARIYAHSGIDTRHSVIRDYDGGLQGGPFFDGASGKMKNPTTRPRNDLYASEARGLFSGLARQAVEDCPGVGTQDITHVITVSCTGFYAPGPEFHIVQDLGLDPSTQRFHVGFMGCYAAFPAMRMARAFCQADQAAVVLVVCLELCTLHLQPPVTLDDMMAGSVFADGASAAVVSARPPDPGAAALEFGPFASSIAPDSEADMAWRVGDNGFDMVLSRYVPRILKMNIAGVVEGLLGRSGRTMADVDRWAIHPGGRAILDGVEKALSLGDEALSASRSVLRRFGNMSSATILFVLKEMVMGGAAEGEALSEEAAEGGDVALARSGETIYAMAFGPGLTVESGLFRRV